METVITRTKFFNHRNFKTIFEQCFIPAENFIPPVKQRFSDVFGGCKIETLARNGLKNKVVGHKSQ